MRAEAASPRSGRSTGLSPFTESWKLCQQRPPHLSAERVCPSGAVGHAAVWSSDRRYHPGGQSADTCRWRADLRSGGSGGFLPDDRKSTRLNSSHVPISYADICLKTTTLISSAHSY